jgi:hypothetical protein
LALGEAKTVRNIFLFWTILQWVLTVPMVLLWNFNGVVLAGIFVSGTFFIPLREVRKKVQINIWPHVWPYLVYSLIAGATAFLLNFLYPAQGIRDLLVFAGTGAFVYLILIFVFKRRELEDDVFRFRRILFR